MHRNMEDGRMFPISTYWGREPRLSWAAICVLLCSRSFLSLAAGPGQCQGQWYTAMDVIVVSRQLDNVRVEQNHCHGLHTDNAS